MSKLPTIPEPISDFSGRYDDNSKEISLGRKSLDRLAFGIGIVGTLVSLEIFIILMFSL